MRSSDWSSDLCSSDLSGIGHGHGRIGNNNSGRTANMPSIAYYAVSLLAVIAAYILGSISFAVVVSRSMGLQDPRTFGSKNPGATNVLRTGNRTAAVLTLLGDAAKGWFAVWLAMYLAGLFALPVLVVGLAAIDRKRTRLKSRPIF